MAKETTNLTGLKKPGRTKGTAPKRGEGVNPITADTRSDDEKTRKKGKAWGQLNIKTSDPEMPKTFKKWCVLNDLTMGEAFEEAFELLKKSRA